MADVIVKIAGDSQSGTPNLPLPIALAAQITNSGVPVPGVTINFAIASYPAGAIGQSLEFASAVTDSNGKVAVIFQSGSKVGTYTVTFTDTRSWPFVPATGSPLTFTETVIPILSFSYTLSSSVTPSGTMHATLLSPESGLTVPVGQTLIYDQDQTERIDSLAGTQEVAAIDVGFIEDYDVYPEGFWMHVLDNSETGLVLTLDDGSGEKDFFSGIVQPGATPLDELYLGASQLRTGSMHLLSFLTRIQTISTQLVAEAAATDSAFLIPPNINGSANGTSRHFYLLTSVIAEAISCATGQSFDNSDVEIPADDFLLGDTGHSYSGFSTFAIEDIEYFSERYPLIWDYINVMLFGFGLVPRWYYDVTTGRHKIILLTRGRSYPTPVTLFTPSQSNLIVGLPVRVQFIDVSSGKDGGKYYLSHQWDQNNSVFVDYDTNTEPVGWKPDISVVMENGAQGAGAYDCVGTYILEGSDLWIALYVQYWDYGASAFVTDLVQMDGAIAKYYTKKLGRFARAYERTYPDLKANDGSTNSQANITLLRKTVINDGVSDQDFYATEVHKNAQTADMFVRWEGV